jgi:hypothetical protein
VLSTSTAYSEQQQEGALNIYCLQRSATGGCSQHPQPTAICNRRVLSTSTAYSDLQQEVLSTSTAYSEQQQKSVLIMFYIL